MQQLYPGQEALLTQLSAELAKLAQHPQVDGVVVDLSDYPEIVSAYQKWDRNRDKPQHANYVAMHVKALLYGLAPAYPNLEYLVVVGDDRAIPQRRIRDDALVSNERHYPDDVDLDFAIGLENALEKRYFFSDDYYADLLRCPGVGGALPAQVAIGRLVETPVRLSRRWRLSLRSRSSNQKDAFVTGYDFLIDEAQAISGTLAAQGIVQLTTLINDDWTANDLRTEFVSVTAASGLNSLNAHFTTLA